MNTFGSKPVGLQSSLLVDDVILLKQAITDTTDRYSKVYNISGLKTKRLLVINNLNQAVNIVSQLSFDNGANWISAGGAKNYAASAGLSVTTENDTTLLALQSIKALLRFRITAAVAPTSGDLTVTFSAMAN